MDTNTQPGAIEVIRLADLTQSISVRLRSTEPALETPVLQRVWVTAQDFPQRTALPVVGQAR
ncbi:MULTISPECIES: hypothetical protein [unclassified Streptomyces]|uniref:hypothetical protein n=1 Tax=Streptomyces sp. NPDC002896 TaxID=3154438 RepID=UPI00332E9145